MKSLLNALQDGRLVELPVREKNQALEYLAALVEAIPDIATPDDLMGQIMEREARANTAVGKGVACPHVRVKGDHELVCAIGWSPEGIDYGAPDGQLVHLVALYSIPDSQKGAFLKELSGLARAIEQSGPVGEWSTLEDLSEVRHHLLDWAEIALEHAVPDAKARMIQLAEKHAVAPAEPHVEPVEASSHVAFSVLRHGTEIHVLSESGALVDHLENEDLVAQLESSSDSFRVADWQILILEKKLFARDREWVSAVALKTHK